MVSDKRVGEVTSDSAALFLSLLFLFSSPWIFLCQRHGSGGTSVSPMPSNYKKELASGSKCNWTFLFLDKTPLHPVNHIPILFYFEYKI
jgi:hypothetical protein